MSKADRVVRDCVACPFYLVTDDWLLKCTARSKRGRNFTGWQLGNLLVPTPPWCPLPITVRKEADHE